MHKCPICGLYMNFEFKWVAGNPVTIWVCVCGHEEVANGYY